MLGPRTITRARALPPATRRSGAYLAPLAVAAAARSRPHPRCRRRYRVLKQLGDGTYGEAARAVNGPRRSAIAQRILRPDRMVRTAAAAITMCPPPRPPPKPRSQAPCGRRSTAPPMRQSLLKRWCGLASPGAHAALQQRHQFMQQRHAPPPPTHTPDSLPSTSHHFQTLVTANRSASSFPGTSACRCAR